MSDSSFSPETSMLIPPGAEPLSSTRLSSFSSTCRVSGKPLNRESQAFWLSDMSDLESHNSHVWNKDEMCKELPMPSSTCLSAVDNKNNPGVVSTYRHQAADNDCDVSQNIPVLSQRENQKSVAFKGSIDYLPVISPDDHHQLFLDQSSDLTLDLSQYPDFLDTKRMATVLQHQGIDVTCPDDVFIFSKEVDTMEDKFDKTVVGPVQLDDDDDEFKSIIQSHISSGSSEYNSCGSDAYQSISTENSGSPLLTEPSAHKSDLTVEQCGFSVRKSKSYFC